MNRKILIAALVAAAGCGGSIAAKNHNPRQDYKIYVDDNGVMRRSDSKEEVSYYGTNYTAPFAYSYRALGYLGKDRRRAIDRDIYHIARMGVNAFRLHLWDAELADSAGNLIANDHLDLLDYMINQLEKRGIDIILTAQTNFGNGYPEKNIDTGAFTYDFDKCSIHEDHKAQEIQERYLRQLAKHVNPYTGRSYAADNAIIAMEINNEPCHSGSRSEVTAYINRMAKALRKSGFDKPILYNVTHNPDVTEAYYDADIDGTTYQWYPTGLVSGHERKGNMLPAFDEYTIPWRDTMPGYGKLARVVYEFDPADVLYSHMYPAVARAFRGQGFQWITQFAYDPIDLAPYNTEYPTHYLNLVYTPAKAISMMVAAEAAKETPRGADYGHYPENTRFGHTHISFEDDLSEFNSPEQFIYSNTTAARPVDAAKLRRVAGHGSSPVVSYGGSGAYFLDAIDGTDVWRLEVLPDVTQIDDPFGNTHLKDAKMVATSGEHQIAISLPALGSDFRYMSLADNTAGSSAGGSFMARPGVYLLAPVQSGFDNALALAKEGAKVAGNIGITEYVAPDDDAMPFTLLAPLDADHALDVAMFPDAYDFKFGRKTGMWYDEPVYHLTVSPSKDGVVVIRRYVADKIARIPDGIVPAKINVKFQSESGDVKADPLPAGTQLAIVTNEGYTYSAPVVLDAAGVMTVGIEDLQPRTGYLLPTPYPVTVTRISPAGDGHVKGFRDIQSVELIIPVVADGATSTYLPERIWIE